MQGMMKKTPGPDQDNNVNCDDICEDNIFDDDIYGDDIFDDIYEYVNDDISGVENPRTSGSTLEKSPKPEDDRSLIFL